MIFKFLRKTLFFFSSAVILASCSQKHDTLRLGTNAAFPPFEYMSGGKITGFDIEIAESIAERSEKTLQIENMDFDALIAALQSDAVDFVAAGMTATEQRRQNVDFSIPYYSSRQMIIVQASDENVKTVKDLRGKIIGCQSGNTGEAYAQENIPEAEVKSFKNVIDASQALKAGTINAIIVDELPALEIVRRNQSLKIVEDDFYTDEYAIAVKKGNTELLSSINNVINSLMEDGTYENLCEKYFRIDGEIPEDSSFWSIMIESENWKLVLEGLAITLLIAFSAIIIGSHLGFIFALCKLSSNKFLNALAGIYTTVIRGIPMATQLMIFYFVIFSPLGVTNTVLVAIIAFGINSGAYCTEIFRAGIQGVDSGQMEAGLSLGLSKNQTLFKVIIPQAVRTSLPTFASEFITLIKETSIASFIAVVDLQRACDNIRNATYNAWIPLLTCAAIYLCLTFGLTKIFSFVEKRMAKSDRN